MRQNADRNEQTMKDALDELFATCEQVIAECKDTPDIIYELCGILYEIGSQWDYYKDILTLQEDG